jgi:hypothetical protein
MEFERSPSGSFQARRTSSEEGLHPAQAVGCPFPRTPN